MTLKNKLFTTSAAVTLVASAIVPVASAAEFQDADQIKDWAKDAIEALVNDEVLQGDENGNFNPTGVVTRATGAEILYKAKKLSTEGTEVLKIPAIRISTASKVPFLSLHRSIISSLSLTFN